MSRFVVHEHIGIPIAEWGHGRGATASYYVLDTLNLYRITATFDRDHASRTRTGLVINATRNKYRDNAEKYAAHLNAEWEGDDAA